MRFRLLLPFPFGQVFNWKFNELNCREFSGLIKSSVLTEFL